MYLSAVVLNHSIIMTSRRVSWRHRARPYLRAEDLMNVPTEMERYKDNGLSGIFFFFSRLMLLKLECLRVVFPSGGEGIQLEKFPARDAR